MRTFRGWVAFHAFNVMVQSLIIAAIIRNPNWPMNIPIGLAIGAAFGLISWPLAKWLRRNSCRRTPPK